MAMIYHIHLDYVNPVHHQRLRDDPKILKLSVSPQSKFRHLYHAPSMTLNGRDLHDVALEAAKDHLPVQQYANAIIVRDDHPEFAWLMLQVQS